MQILDIHLRDSFTPLCLETCTKIFKRHFFLATEKKKRKKIQQIYWNSTENLLKSRKSNLPLHN